MSNAILSYNYNPRTRELTVLFPERTSYTYLDVPPARVRAFEAAESLGAFHNYNIRGQFPVRRNADV